MKLCPGLDVTASWSRVGFFPLWTYRNIVAGGKMDRELPETLTIFNPDIYLVQMVVTANFKQVSLLPIVTAFLELNI